MAQRKEESTMTQAQKKKLFGRDFTLMVAGQIISLFGNAALRFALSMAVLDLTGSAALFLSLIHI